MAGSLGMLDSWNRILELIPPSRRSTAEQQQRLMSMQLSMVMGAAAMNQRKAAGELQQLNNPRQAVQAERDEEDEDEESAEDEEGDEEEIRAMKAEIRQLRAEKLAATAPSAVRVEGSSRPSDAAEAAMRDALQLMARQPSLDDPD